MALLSNIITTFLIMHCIVLLSGTRVTCEMVLDGGGRFIPAGIVGLHIIFVTCVPGST